MDEAEYAKIKRAIRVYYAETLAPGKRRGEIAEELVKLVSDSEAERGLLRGALEGLVGAGEAIWLNQVDQEPWQQLKQALKEARAALGQVEGEESNE